MCAELVKGGVAAIFPRERLPNPLPALRAPKKIALLAVANPRRGIGGKGSKPSPLGVVNKLAVGPKLAAGCLFANHRPLVEF